MLLYPFYRKFVLQMAIIFQSEHLSEVVNASNIIQEGSIGLSHFESVRDQVKMGLSTLILFSLAVFGATAQSM